MFHWANNILLILSLTTSAIAGDRVSHWLSSMGCDQLLAAYLEEGIDKGTMKQRITAANELANVYAILLSRSGAEEDIELLKRATSLFDKIPEAGTTTLKLQLLRAAYLSAEQMLERYRLRFTDKANADEAAVQLESIISKLKPMHATLMQKIGSGKKITNTVSENAGLSASLLAWCHYYLALHTNSLAEAGIASGLFAAALQGDRASMQNVSLDLKAHEQGARAILGIALCKDLMDDPAGPEPWLEVLEATDSHVSVRKAVPMWRFFGDIEKSRWSKALEHMTQVTDADMTLIYRLAAVRALGYPENSDANVLAHRALTKLISLKQFAMVSSIVEEYGFSALQENSFIAQFIKADLDFRKARESMQSDLPTESPELVEAFTLVARGFDAALLAKDAAKFTSLHDDCYFAKAYSFYYSSIFAKAAKAFAQASKGNNAETAIWMLIISLESMDKLDNDQEVLLQEMMDLYLATWPDTERSTQLLLHKAADASETVLVEDLLKVPKSSPSFEQSQRRAARLLYDSWMNATPQEQQSVGNQYVNVALSLILADQIEVNDKTSIQRAVVRALRILEVSLHKAIRREVAADQAFAVLETIEEQALYDLDEFEEELLYRHLVSELYANDFAGAFTRAKSTVSISPKSAWATASAKTLWKSWEEEGYKPTGEERFFIGSNILASIADTQYGAPSYLRVAIGTSRAGLAIYELGENQESGIEALRIVRLLLALYPKSEECLVLAAKIERLVGDNETALQHWTQVLVSSRQSSELWLEAKYMTALLKSESDPEAALVILDQFKLLYPNYGAGKLSDELRQLHEGLQTKP
jgi:hypothetical protein